MTVTALRHAYITLDRLAFFQLSESRRLSEICGGVRRVLENRSARPDLDALVRAGAEEEEILWLLVGCRGMAGVANLQELFGWSARELRKALENVATARRIMEKSAKHPFGVLLQLADPLAAQAPEHLRSYLALARVARHDFGYHSQWFINIAKARLVLHVTHATRQPHDREVSGLVSAITDTSYDSETHRRWRHKHAKLLNSNLDPYTIQGRDERQRALSTLLEGVSEMPTIRDTVAALTRDYWKLAEFRSRKRRDRKSIKTAG